jgi:hypothetical protein
MNVVDSSGWLEYFADGRRSNQDRRPNTAARPPLERTWLSAGFLRLLVNEVVARAGVVIRPAAPLSSIP